MGHKKHAPYLESNALLVYLVVYILPPSNTLLCNYPSTFKSSVFQL
jgi:hypothetical protein